MYHYIDLVYLHLICWRIKMIEEDIKRLKRMGNNPVKTKELFNRGKRYYVEYICSPKVRYTQEK